MYLAAEFITFVDIHPKKTMKKREFIKLTGLAGAGLLVSPFLSCSDSGAPATSPETPATKPGFVPFELPALGFGFADLEPNIDAMTMEIHHGKHHAGYVSKLNAALEAQTDLHGMDIAQLMESIEPGNTDVRNNGGGHYNHSLFWKVIAPGGAAAPTGKLADAIQSAFGSYEVFKQQFADAATKRFGSGWAWLSVNNEGKLFVSSTPNQDNPHMYKVVEEPGLPILGIDVWEHAYYLNYQNRRGDYISAFSSLINWNEVEKRYDEITA